MGIWDWEIRFPPSKETRVHIWQLAGKKKESEGY